MSTVGGLELGWARSWTNHLDCDECVTVWSHGGAPLR